MPTVTMEKTVACENADGVDQVFGPAGKEFTVDDKTAERLAALGAVTLAEKPKAKRAKGRELPPLEA